MLDSIADRHFAKDESGRLVFLPRGPRRPAYVVDSSDQPKIKALVKVYVAAAAMINLTGSVAALAFTQALTFDERSSPLAYKLKFGLVIYAISAALLYIGPALLLWSVYSAVVKGLDSSLTTVDPASLRLTPSASSSRPIWAIFVAVGFLLLAFGIFALVSYRR